MATFYSPEGNPEVWETKPDGYQTVDEWLADNPLEMLETSDMPDMLFVPLEERVAAMEDVLLEILMGGA